MRVRTGPVAGARRTVALTLLVLAAGCSSEPDGWRPGQVGTVWTPFGNVGEPYGRNTPAVPEGSLTVQRLRGRPGTFEPLRPEPGNVWPAEEAPRATLANPEAALRGIPTYQPGGQRPAGFPTGREPPVTPDPASLNPPAGSTTPGAPRRRGSSSPPPSPSIPDASPTLRQPAAEPSLPYLPPARSGAGRVIPVPGGGPAITGGGTGAYQTFTRPGGGSGIAVPNGSGGTILSNPGGGTTLVPNP